MRTITHPGTALAVAGLALSGLAACSSDSSSSQATSTSPAASDTAATSPAASDTAASPSGSGPACDKTAITAALPDGSTVVKYTCDEAGVEYWAAAEVEQGPTVFFLKWTGDTWDAMASDAVCGTASAGLPQDILAYCDDAN